MTKLIAAVAAVAVAALMVSLAPDTSQAQSRRRAGAIVRTITITGNTYFREKELKSVMRTKQSSLLRTRRFREVTLESDLVSIVALYRRNGFLDASAEAQEIRYDDERTYVWISIKVAEGRQTVVEEVIVEGSATMAESALRSLLAVRVGKPLDERQITDDKYAIYAYYADRGFVFASVAHEVLGENGQATVRYKISEGEPATIARIDVRGNNRVSERLIKREVLLRPADTFSRKKLLDSQQRLYDTGLFKDVEVEPSQAGVEAGSVNLMVKVKERQMREVSLGLGYGTRDELRGTAGWFHRNLWNSGRQVEATTVLASRSPDKGLTRKRGEVALTDRWLFGRRLAGGVSVFGNESLEDYREDVVGEYTLRRIGFGLSVRKEIRRTTRLTLGYTHEMVNIRDPSWTVEDPDQLRIKLGQEVNRSASLVVERDTRVPFFDPQGGSLTRVVAKTSGGLFRGDNSYNKATVSWARYYRVQERTVLAVGARIGHAEAFGGSKAKGVPEYERFFAGGSSTVRGYDEREFGPGDFLLLGNVELRYALPWKIAGVAFFDMGNAWPSVRSVSRRDFALRVPAEEYAARRAKDCKYSVGVGVGYQTPVGPARLDYGLRLKRGFVDSPDGGSNRKESAGMLHFTIGHAF